MNDDPQKPTTRSLQWYEYIYAGLPLILIGFGGALGGLCGGLAFGINVKILQKGSSGLRYLFPLLVALAAFIGYFAIAAILVTLFPSLAAK